MGERAALLMWQQMVLPPPHHSQGAVVTDPVKLPPALATVTSGVRPSTCLSLMCLLHTGVRGASCCVSLQGRKVSDGERGNDRIIGGFSTERKYRFLANTQRFTIWIAYNYWARETFLSKTSP